MIKHPYYIQDSDNDGYTSTPPTNTYDHKLSILEYCGLKENEEEFLLNNPFQC